MYVHMYVHIMYIYAHTHIYIYICAVDWRHVQAGVTMGVSGGTE